MTITDPKTESAPPLAKQPIAAIVMRDGRLFAVAFLCLLGLGSILATLYFLTQDHLKNSIVQTAARYTEAIAEFRTIYTSEVVARLLPKGIEVTHDYDTRDGAIPLPATLSILLANRLRALGTGVEWNLYSDYPFPWRTDSGPQDAFEAEALKQLQRDQTRPFYRFEYKGDQEVLRYATVDLMRPSCVGCHNSHPDSPKIDWRAGDVRGVLAVTLPVVASIGGQLTGVNQAFVISGGLIVLGGILLSMVIVRHRFDAAMVAQHAANLEREARIRKRTEEQLRRSNADLLQFAHIASHDLSEPARKVMAFGDLLSAECGEALGDVGKDYLEKMVDASKRMRILIAGLLDYSRVSRIAIPFTEMDLTEIANDAKSDLSQALADTSGRIEIGDLPSIKANGTQIRQLFQNLMANGLKFHRDGVPPVVKVEAQTQEDTRSSSVVRPGPTCRITVSDNGIGFDPKYRDSIFQVFERLHGRDEYEGTGIGLAVCRKVCERHGGAITAESRPGEGATFTVVLPIDQPSDTRDDGGTR